MNIFSKKQKALKPIDSIDYLINPCCQFKHELKDMSAIQFFQLLEQKGITQLTCGNCGKLIDVSELKTFAIKKFRIE